MALDTKYEPKNEPEIYAKWEKSGFFNPDICIKKGVTKKTAKPYSIVLPPPNVTGTLHMGHAAMLAVEDILVRYARMQGNKTLWIPGTDHAAIATQAKVEQEMYKKEGKTRHDLGREPFLEKVRAFAKQSHDTIVTQVKAVGASLDWSREAYTLDEERNLAVRTAFERMYKDGLIYRGARLVNWDPKLQTTVSDDEIEWVEEKVPLYYLKYGPFEIATARPETKFGDKYVVMHPKDKRYAQWKHGDKVDLEWINGKVTATIIKDPVMDMEFGTGVMTITPWHDATDFDLAERHNLEKEQIIDFYGKLMPLAGEFAGIHIKKARPLLVEKLKEKGLLVRVEENYVHRIATNSRGGGVIEPQIKEQWFIDVNKKFKLPKPVAGPTLKGIKTGSMVSLKELMHQVVKSGQITIRPHRFDKIYHHWITNLRDWCISRQIWFGHRVPVWYCLQCGKPVANPTVQSKWFLVRHGETDLNKNHIVSGRKDIPLNETGLAQAEETARKLVDQNIGLIISSPLLRARQTAEAIAKATGAKIIFDDQIMERDFGKAEGMPHDDLDNIYPNFWLDYEGKAAGNESYAEAEKRVSAAFQKHRTDHPGKNVVIVTHAGVIRTLLKHIRNWDPDYALAYPPIPNATPLQLDTLKNKCSTCKHDLFEQDADTLDTWFSSGLWTFSTLGWPKMTPDLKTFHPTDVLETGYDIISFWVSRMILMTGYNLGTIPFRDVYLHGLVRDGQGRKMSKSLGNIIDPLDMVNKYGADATRMSLIIGAAVGNDIKLSEDRVRGYRNFSTKIWNATRFVLMNCEKPVDKKKVKYSAADKAMLKKLAEVKKKTEKHIQKFELHLAAENLYHFFWHYYADKVIEAMKPRLNKGDGTTDKETAKALLLEFQTSLLKMLHPFMPFVTEALWQEFRPGTLLMVEKW